MNNNEVKTRISKRQHTLLLGAIILLSAGCSSLYEIPAPPAAPKQVVLPPSPRAPGKLVNISFYGGGKSNHKLSRYTASGERFNPDALTAAHRTLPFGTQIRLRNPDNDQEVVVRVNDRGPFIKNRELDISHAAAKQLGIVEDGVKHVEMTIESANNL